VIYYIYEVKIVTDENGFKYYVVEVKEES